MWQVLLAAAVAGSTGLVAKHILGFNVNPNATSLADKSNGCDESCKDQEEPDSIIKSKVSIDTKFDSPMVSNGMNETERDDIFRFSSSGSRGATSFRLGSKIMRKKARSRCRVGSKNAEVENCAGARESVMEQRKSCGRSFVCLKKRKTGKNIGASKGGSCSSKDGSLFHWGLGVGIMCMMSAGKEEINKLNTTVGETAKVVKELKSEIYKKKFSRQVQTGKACENSAIEKSSEIKCILSIFDDGECESSVLTEDRELEVHEMDQLEAELATELKKLPWCSTDDSYLAGDGTNLEKTEVSVIKDFHASDNQASHSNAYHLNGVPPDELDKKLCHLLIEQQENQIVELESELHVAQTKLQEKESELQALKNCVKRLTEFSLSTVSDDEPEAHAGKKQNTSTEHSNQISYEEMKSVVGMKRPVESDSWDCYV